MIDKETLGNKLKLARLTKNLSQFKLEELVNIDQRQIARYENGECYPNLENFVKLASALNADIEELLEFNCSNMQIHNSLVKKIVALNSKQIGFVEKIIDTLTQSNLS